jgi:hypothetical protein
MAVKMPKQPFPGGALGPGWHDYIAQIEKNSETLDSLDTRATALENTENEIVSRDRLADGFGRILLSETEETITYTGSLGAVENAADWEPEIDQGVEVYSKTLTATTDESRFRVALRAFLGGSSASVIPTVAITAWLGNANVGVFSSSLMLISASNMIVGVHGEFWCDAGEMSLRALDTRTLTTPYFNLQGNGSSALMGGTPSKITIEEWAVI